MTTITRTRRQQKDHDRYIRDRERRLAMQKSWDDAHPDYHKEFYRKRVLKEIDRQKRLKRLEEEIWNYQMRTLTS